MVIKGEEFLAFLDQLIDQAQINVWEYEEFYEDKLAHIPSMSPIDSFLYGIASGKLQILEDLKTMVEERIKELD
jgi:hypothetical protein